jgi:hypothetical protein
MAFSNVASNSASLIECLRSPIKAREKPCDHAVIGGETLTGFRCLKRVIAFVTPQIAVPNSGSCNHAPQGPKIVSSSSIVVKKQLYDRRAEEVTLSTRLREFSYERVILACCQGATSSRPCMPGWSPW